MDLVIAKRHKHGRFYEAVVMDRDNQNEIVFASGLGFNKAGRRACSDWMTVNAARITLERTTPKYRESE